MAYVYACWYYWMPDKLVTLLIITVCWGEMAEFLRDNTLIYFSWMKIVAVWFKFHWRLLQRVQLTAIDELICWGINKAADILQMKFSNAHHIYIYIRISIDLSVEFHPKGSTDKESSLVQAIQAITWPNIGRYQCRHMVSQIIRPMN